MKRILFIIFLTTTLISCSSKLTKNNDDFVIIGSFNIEWLGDGINDQKVRNESDYKRIAEVIENTDADVLGLEEVENKAALQKVMKYLPEYNFILGNTGTQQNTAIVYKKNVEVKFIQNYDKLVVKENRTRAGLVASVKKGNFDWIMMVVHLKSTSRYDSTEALRIESYELRKKQAEILKNWADSIVTNTKEQDIIIVGDFNDNPKRHKTQNMLPLVEDNNMTFLTQDLISCKNPRWDMIDHIVVNNSAKKRFQLNSLFIYNIYNAYSKYDVENISDHCPIVCSFEIISPDND